MNPSPGGVVSPFASQRYRGILSARLSPSSDGNDNAEDDRGPNGGHDIYSPLSDDRAVSSERILTDASKTSLHSLTMLLSGDEADYDDGGSSSFSEDDDEVDTVDGDDTSGRNENDDSMSSVDDYLDKRTDIKRKGTTDVATSNRRQRLINSFRQQSQQFHLNAQQQQQNLNYPLSSSKIQRDYNSSSSSASKDRHSSPKKSKSASSSSSKKTKDNRTITRLIIEDYDFSLSNVVVSLGDVIEIALGESVPSHAEHTLYGVIAEDDTITGALLFESPLLQVRNLSRILLAL
jgi:hypothetical protein